MYKKTQTQVFEKQKTGSSEPEPGVETTVDTADKNCYTIAASKRSRMNANRHPSELASEREALTLVILCSIALGVILGYAWARAQDSNRRDLCHRYGEYCTESDLGNPGPLRANR